MYDKWKLLFFKSPMSDWMIILKLYCSSQPLSSFSYPVIRAPIRLCFTVVLIDLRPTGDGVKVKVVAKQI